ncbi:MAG: EscU/YscU/HrcU family type III secretion system export apparatus switch protein, partial [Longimicrobiales bacterium]
MSESFQDRTETATPRRREEAHNKGDVPKSSEVTTAAILLVAAATVHIAGPGVAGGLAEIYGTTTMAAAAPPLGIDGVVQWLRAIGWRTMVAAAPVLVALALTGFGIAAAQARG